MNVGCYKRKRKIIRAQTKDHPDAS